jgi:hypothetical protein
MEAEGSLPCSQEPATGPCPEPDESSPHPPLFISLRSILMLSPHIRLGLPSGIFPSGFPTKILHAILIYPIRATSPTHLTFLDLITLIIFGEAYKLCSSSLCSLIQPPATSSLLGPNIAPRALFSLPLQLFSFNAMQLQ